MDLTFVGMALPSMTSPALLPAGVLQAREKRSFKASKNNATSFIFIEGELQYKFLIASDQGSLIPWPDSRPHAARGTKARVFSLGNERNPTPSGNTPANI